MARPREFDEEAVLDAATQHFWLRGYEATSIRDLTGCTGLTGASLYNAFGDKRSLYQTVLDRYVERSVAERIRRCNAEPPRRAILQFFADILSRSLDDDDHKGCLLVNTALDVAPHDPEFKAIVAAVLLRIETFFREKAEAGIADGSIASMQSATDLARHLLGMLIGIRVLARVRPEPELLEGIARSVEALLRAPEPPAHLS